MLYSEMGLFSLFWLHFFVRGLVKVRGKCSLCIDFLRSTSEFRHELIEISL